MAKNIVLLASGTRGDVQPYVALAKTLVQAGYHAVLATHQNYVSLLSQSSGVEIQLLHGNPSELFMQPAGQSAMNFNGSIRRGLIGTLRYLRDVQPVNDQLIQSCWRVCQGADAIIAGLPVIWAGQIASALSIPVIFGLLQPLSRTSEFPCSLFPKVLPGAAWINRLTYRLVDAAIWVSWKRGIDRWRKMTLGVPAIPTIEMWSKGFLSNQPVCYAYSRFVVERPADWPFEHRVTGYWNTPLDPAWSPDGGLVQFLDCPGPKLFIGFGSPGADRPQDLLSVVRAALDKVGARGVVDMPSNSDLGRSSSGILYPVSNTPHAWLFPQMDGFIHHGGAGTTAAGLHAGKPSMIIPRSVDQFFWASRIHALGAGTTPVPQNQLTIANLSDGMNQILTDQSMHQKSDQISQQLHTEDGLSSGVEFIRKIV